jgi:SOS-response transcriptional repressor LexA
MMGLTTRQREALDYIGGYIRENRCSPKYEEIASAIGLRSRSGAYRVICELEERGAIVTKPGRRRSILVVGPSLLGPADLETLTDDQLHQQRRDLAFEITRRTNAKAIARANEIVGQVQ